MEYRAFGSTGIQISAMGFGCWEIGGGYGSIEEADFIKAINRALDLGINSFDTAEAYGMGASETSLAKALGSRRKEAVITTKFGVGYIEAKDRNFRDSSRNRVMASIEKSRTCSRSSGWTSSRDWRPTISSGRHPSTRSDAGLW